MATLRHNAGSASCELRFPEALITAHEGLADALGVDPKDRHVLVCAIRSGAQTIVSDNRRHFPASVPAPLGVECISASDFLVQRYHLSPDRFIGLLTEQARDAGMPFDQLLNKLPLGLRALIHP